MEESGIGIDERAARFEHMTPLAMPSDQDLGLCVSFEGSLVLPSPRAPGLPLHPWEGVLSPTGEGCRIAKRGGGIH
jgi:hypothetical protein